MSTEEKIPISVRQHICWCDSCFCNCPHEVTNLKTGEVFKLSGRDLSNHQKYDIIWSNEAPTYAPYIQVSECD